MIIGTCSYLS